MCCGIIIRMGWNEKEKGSGKLLKQITFSTNDKFFKKISKKGLTNWFIYSRIHLVAEVNTSGIKTNAIVA